MARTTDGGMKKRQRPNGSDSPANDAKMHEESPGSMKQDRSLRPRSKESPPELAKRMHTDATNMPSSFQQQTTAEKSGEKDAKLFSGTSGQHSSPHDSLGPRKKAKRFPDVEHLRLYVETLGGVLKDGWQVDAHRSLGGKLTKTFISPSKDKFRSRIEVAKHLGLDVNSLKKGEIAKANSDKISTDHDEEAHMAEETSDPVTLQDKNGWTNSPRKRSHAMNSGQKKEHSSKSPNFHETAAPNTNNGLILASDASKAIVDIQKVPETSNVTQQCQDALRSIISTETFAALSRMLNWGASSGSLESPLQLKAFPLVTSSLDLQLIHLRLSTGVYGQTPEQFFTDIQEVWTRVTAVGTELVALASALSEFSDNLYQQQIASLFQGDASKEFSERKGLLLSTSQHGKQSIEDSGFSLNNLHVLQENQLVTPPESTAAIQATLPEKSIPSQEKPTNQAAESSPQSFSKKVSAVGRSHKSKKRWPKKVSNSKRPTVLESKAADNATPKVCKSCGLQQQGKDFVVCRLCSAVFHAHCLDLPPKSLPDNAWCCASCAAKENATEDDKSREPLKTTGKTGVCEACKKEDDNVLLCDACEAAYHMNCLDPPIESLPDECWYCPACAEEHQKSMVSLEDVHENHAHPDGHNCAVCDRISKDSLMSNENTSTEHAVLQNPSLEGARSPDYSSEHGALKDIVQLESLEACVENLSPEPGFLLENENACKVCGVESKKSVVSCAWCSKRFHLSCLRPPLKRPPRKAWFCPSCLCRVCKIDADDDKILLCDTCDEGYHTYCLNPPLSDKPEGAWFCPSCAKDMAPSSPKQTEVLKRKRKSTEPRRST